MKHRSFKALGLTVLLVSLLLLVGCNQELGTLTVEVKDETGEHLNATVTARRSEQTEETESSDGVAQFKDIPTGTYELEIKKEGYQTITETVTMQEESLNYEVTLKEKTYNLNLNLTDQAEEDLSAAATLKGADTTHTTTIKNGTATIENLKPGSYDLAVTKDGYQKVTKELTIEDENLTTNLQLAKTEPETTEQDEKEEQQKKVDLKVKVFDSNNNQLPAQVQIKQNDSVLKEKNDAQVNFKDLKAGQYVININKPGYEDWNKEIELTEDSTLNATLKGGAISYKIFSAAQGEQKIQVDDLAEDEEVIVALTKLNWDDIKENSIYEPRRKENQLVEEFGTDFVTPESNYQIGDTKEFKLPQKTSEKETISADLVKKGEHIYLFKAEDSYLEEEDLEKLVTEFDEQIYPSLTNKNKINDKITVLLSDFSDYQMTGYFEASDLYDDLGNEEPMFYLNARRSGNTLLTSAAHQYQHLTFFIDKANAGRIANDAWINQGLSQLAPQLLGYIDPANEGWSPENGNGWVYNQDFGYLNKTSKVNLLTHDGSLSFTGASGLFANYLIDHYGAELISELTTSSQDPKKVIADYTGTTFDHVYLNWITTNVTDSIEEIDNSIYNYSEFDLAQLPKLSDEQQLNDGVTYFKVKENQFSINPPEGYEGDIGVVIIKHQTN
ncbi:MAG: MSCRAMM family protein [Bacillota bacterium]